MAEARKTAGELRRAYSNHNVAVEVVCCWHSWHLNKVPDCTFERFPHPVSIDGNGVTPDFLVEFSNGDGYTLVGEVCRLPNQDDGFRKSVAQAKGYAALGEKHDVIVLVPFSDGPECELRIREQQLLEDDEPVVLIGHGLDSLADRECWKFVRVSSLRDARFRDDFLGPELSLGQRLCDRYKALKIPAEYCAENKRQYPFINDTPPPIYCAWYLWMKVIPLARTSHDFIMGRIEDKDDPVRTTVSDLHAICENDLGVKMTTDWIRSGLDFLRQARLATEKDGEYTVHLAKIQVTKSGDRELVSQLAERVGAPEKPESPPPGQEVLDLDQASP